MIGSSVSVRPELESKCLRNLSSFTPTPHPSTPSHPAAPPHPQGQYREASFAWSSALGLTQRLEGPNSTTTAGCMVNLAVSYMNLGDLGQAPEFLLTKALRVFEEDDRTTEEKFEPFKEKNIEPIANTNTILGHLYYQVHHHDLAMMRSTVFTTAPRALNSH